MSSTKPTPNTADPIPLTSAERMRRQFEELHWTTELAPDIDCFRPEGELPTIRYIAHPHSLHVRRWLQVLSHTRTRVSIESPFSVPAFSGDFLSARSILPTWLRLPKMLGYVLSGLALRFFGRQQPGGLIHAHSASGNGLVAWLSGQKYVIGTYGSEIYQAKERGPFYCWLLKQILQGAERIQNALPSGSVVLTEQFGIAPEKIYPFYMGYDDATFRWLDQSARNQMRRAEGLPTDQPVWAICRRTNPYYRTFEVVEGFLQHCLQGGRGNLIVMCGDHTPDYTRQICDMIQAHSFGDRVTMIQSLLSPNELAYWLQLSDFGISVPTTDNLSTALLESMGCGNIPVLSNLKTYDDLRPSGRIYWMDQFKSEDFTRMFTETSSKSLKSIEADRKACQEFVHALFSTEQLIRVLAAFYLGRPLPTLPSHQTQSTVKAA